jgi:integrase
VRIGASLPSERQTVEQYLAIWLDHQKGRLRPRAWESYEQTVRLHLVPGLGKIVLARLKPAQLDAWFRQHQQDGASARSVRYARTVLRAALNQARRWRVVTDNVAALVEVPRHQAKEIQPLTPEHARALLKAAKGQRLGGLVSVAIALGLRMGEALGLRWVDVDFEAGTLRVRQALERSGGDSAARRRLIDRRRTLRKQLMAAPPRSVARRELRQELEALRSSWREVRTTLHTAEPKSSRSRRTIRMPAIVATALKAHRLRQLEDRLAAGGEWVESGFVFTTPTGTALDARNVSRAFRALLLSAQLPAVRFRSAAHGGDPALGTRRRSPHDYGDLGALSNQPDLEHLQPRPAGASGRRRGQVGRDSDPLGFHLGFQTKTELMALSKIARKTGEPGRNRTFNPQIKRTPGAHPSVSAVCFCSEITADCVRFFHRYPPESER